jgi:hypothetical protein
MAQYLSIAPFFISAFTAPGEPAIFKYYPRANARSRVSAKSAGGA